MPVLASPNLVCIYMMQLLTDQHSKRSTRCKCPDVCHLQQYPLFCHKYSRRILAHDHSTRARAHFGMLVQHLSVVWQSGTYWKNAPLYMYGLATGDTMHKHTLVHV